MKRSLFLSALAVAGCAPAAKLIPTNVSPDLAPRLTTGHVTQWGPNTAGATGLYVYDPSGALVGSTRIRPVYNGANVYLTTNKLGTLDPLYLRANSWPQTMPWGPFRIVRMTSPNGAQIYDSKSGALLITITYVSGRFKVVNNATNETAYTPFVALPNITDACIKDIIDMAAGFAGVVISALLSETLAAIGGLVASLGLMLKTAIDMKTDCK